MNNAEWKVKSLRNLIESHVSDYRTVFDAYYEFPKNLEEAGAKNIYIELLHEQNKILLYGDGKGLNATDLDRIRESLADSNKDLAHHGVGMLAFMFFCEKIVMVSRKEGRLYITSCLPSGDKIISDVGGSREITKDDPDYQRYFDQYRPDFDKLHKIKDPNRGTITIFEGVGKSHSDRFNFTFDMKNRFEGKELGTFEKGEAKDFLDWLKTKVKLSLREHIHYFLKKDDHSPLKAVEVKFGNGTRKRAVIPSAAYPIETLDGQNKNSFTYNGRLFSLKVVFDFFIGATNDGDIRISQKRQDSLPIKDAITSNMVSYDSIYKNPDYTKFLTGMIDFEITPLDEGQTINVWSGTRTNLIMDMGFGACLANILNFADREIYRPLLKKYDHKNVRDKQTVLRTASLQKDINLFLMDNKDILDDLIKTKSTGPVKNPNVVKCTCGISVVPKRVPLGPNFRPETNNIYADDNSNMYQCGTCGRKWAKRAYVSSGSHGTSSKPQYTPPDLADQMMRKKKRGYGFRLVLTPFESGCEQRARVYNDLVQINQNHPQYLEISKSDDHDIVLNLYERLAAFDAIIDHEMADADREEYATMINKVHNRFLVWFQTKRSQMSKIEFEKRMKLHQEESDKKDAVEAAAHVCLPQHSPAPVVHKPPPVQHKSVADLKVKWGAKLTPVKA